MNTRKTRTRTSLKDSFIQIDKEGNEENPKEEGHFFKMVPPGILVSAIVTTACLIHVCDFMKYEISKCLSQNFSTWTWTQESSYKYVHVHKLVSQKAFGQWECTAL